MTEQEKDAEIIRLREGLKRITNHPIHSPVQGRPEVGLPSIPSCQQIAQDALRAGKVPTTETAALIKALGDAANQISSLESCIRIQDQIIADQVEIAKIKGNLAKSTVFAASIIMGIVGYIVGIYVAS